MYAPEVLSELKLSLEDLTALLRCRKALCDEGIKAVLELLYSMHSYYVSITPSVTVVVVNIYEIYRSMCILFLFLCILGFIMFYLPKYGFITFYSYNMGFITLYTNKYWVLLHLDGKITTRRNTIIII